MQRLTVISCFLLFFICSPFSAGQDISAESAAENTTESTLIEPFRIKLDVNEVRLDVVALDKKTGNPVTDLTADDFEVYQNGKRQDILSSVFVDIQSGVATQTSVSRKNSRKLPPLPAIDLKKEDVRRTIVFVIDDLSMRFESTHYAKMAIRNFVEKQMQQGDLVAIIRTGYGNSAFQMFLSDRRELLARIDSMRLTIKNDDSADYFSKIYDSQLSIFSYSIRALKDMPGRKSLIVMTEDTEIHTSLMSSIPSLNAEKPGSFDDKGIDFNAQYSERFSNLSDEALRAGVVVNFLNINGLSNFKSNMADAAVASREKATMQPGASWNGRTALAEYNSPGDPSVSHGLNPLPAKTGGVLIKDSNFFLDGIGKETDSLMRGYYLISYVPPPSTFDRDSGELYHQIRIKVKRKNVEVYTRDGFFNRPEDKTDDAVLKNTLFDAIISPFKYANLEVNMAAGYSRDAKAGYFVRSWIHLDPKDVKIAATEDGGGRIDLEVVCLTSDINGNVYDLVEAKYAFNIEPEKKVENTAWIQKHGIRFAMLLPVKKPGSYYVRTAVQDTESGHIGSAYQYVEIPDLGKKGLALSSMFMITSDADLNWLISDAAGGLASGLFFPVFQAEEVRSPALRTYAMGNKLQTLAMIYNADEKAVADSEILTQSVLYKDGEELMRGVTRPGVPGGAGSLEGIPIGQTLTMGSDLTPGDYVLELVVIDKKNSGRKEGFASQAISFKIGEK